MILLMPRAVIDDPKTTMKLEPKHDHSAEIPPKTYDLNSEISHGVNSARNIE